LEKAGYLYGYKSFVFFGSAGLSIFMNMKSFFYKALIFLPLSISLAIFPFSSAFSEECSNEGRPCSHDDDTNSSIPKCCVRDRDSGKELVCNAASVGEIGECVNK